MSRKAIKDIAVTVKASLTPLNHPAERFNYYSIPDLDETGHPSVVEGKEIASAKNLVTDGVILVSKLNPRIKRVWKVDAESQRRNLASTEFIALKPEPADVDYLYYALHSEDLWRHLCSCAIGSTNSHTRCKPRDLENFEIEVAEHHQRPVIARILCTVDALIESTEALIAKQQQIKQGMLQDLFTRGVDANGQLRPPHNEAPELYHETELGWLPKGWEVKRMDQVGSIRGRVGWKGYTVHDLRDNGPLVLGAAQISKDNRLDLHDPVYLSQEKYLESPEIMVSTGDILIVQRGSIGKVTIVDIEIGPATINPSMILFKISGVNSSFLYHWLCTHDLQAQIQNATSSTGVPMISQAQAGSFLLPYPTPEEQKEIGFRLDLIMKRMDLDLAEAAKLKLLKSGLMQDLLSGKVSVEPLVEKITELAEA